jgi:hypothetical protein
VESRADIVIVSLVIVKLDGSEGDRPRASHNACSRPLPSRWSSTVSGIGLGATSSLIEDPPMTDEMMN